MIRVLLVDDQALIRTGFRMILGAQPDISVVGEAADGAEAAARAAELTPDVVLMDIQMPGVNGVAATERIAERSPATRVLVLTTFDLDEYVVAALRAGASGFLTKDIAPEDLVDAVRVVHRGEAVVTPRLLTRLIGTLIGPAPSVAKSAAAGLLDRLTEREREVLLLIARGRANAEIAAELGLSGSTVKNHVTSVFAKIGARDRAQAVIVAYESGLVALPG
ncbi:DNA-binding response regulator [Sphaerisporangium rufum]|uniref:DNA-binding response regulator n=1 Tax=Sphaerisporangium rufum TaxID=1381558 RepID=A0A919V540_9ACTN|nr:response regulator transcription factor [Sphaerisporangium rufum]GII77910.1 DNA-binding response regulator [Sphaerisporangium rufum]